jgi:hypothetical protein
MKEPTKGGVFFKGDNTIFPGKRVGERSSKRLFQHKETTSNEISFLNEGGDKWWSCFKEAYNTIFYRVKESMNDLEFFLKYLERQC